MITAMKYQSMLSDTLPKKIDLTIKILNRNSEGSFTQNPCSLTLLPLIYSWKQQIFSLQSAPLGVQQVHPEYEIPSSVQQSPLPICTCVHETTKALDGFIWLVVCIYIIHTIIGRAKRVHGDSLELTKAFHLNR